MAHRPLSEIVRLRIDLDAVTPHVRRRIEVPATITLDDLHRAIQIAMGWTNTHLYEFRIGRTAYGIPDRDWDVPGPAILPAKKTRLAELLAGHRKRFDYVYDFGDDWRHTIRIETITAADPTTFYPRYLDGESRCPPEDVGGPWGYAEFLAAIADPNHDRHAELLDWCSGRFDPAAIEEAGIRKAMDRYGMHGRRFGPLLEAAGL
jgi:Plasmid pRiA4b ORF-3-like protein